jgi:hypothetical protein
VTRIDDDLQRMLTDVAPPRCSTTAPRTPAPPTNWPGRDGTRRTSSSHDFVGNPNVLTWLLGRPPTAYEQFVVRTVRSFG